MKKSIIYLAICVVLALLIGVVGIKYISGNSSIYPATEPLDFVNSIDDIEEYEINKEDLAKGAFSKSITYVGDYEITIETQKEGHPSNGSIFSTYCDIKNENSSVNIDYYFYLKDVEKDVFNYSKYEDIKIGKNKFKYNIDTSKNTITLYYKNNQNSYLEIVLKGGLKFDESGSTIGNLNMDEKILKSDYIEDEIIFEINKMEN